jgi:hypothetical protein
MSTQRREVGCPKAMNNYRQGSRDRWQQTTCTDRVDGLGRIWLLFMAWFVRAIATVGTAPPQEASSLPTAWTATDSLQSDHTSKFVRQDLRRTSRSSPPLGAGRYAITGIPVTRRSSLRLTPPPSELLSILPPSPYHPAGQCRWTERYDGKRDLHFLNAA